MVYVFAAGVLWATTFSDPGAIEFFICLVAGGLLGIAIAAHRGGSKANNRQDPPNLGVQQPQDSADG